MSSCITMIIKNAGPVIQDVLKSWQGVTNGFCILDTGSTDNTIQLIKDLNIKKLKLFEHEFEGFSNSRNRCIRLAEKHFKTDFYIMIDDSYALVDCKDTPISEQLRLCKQYGHKLIAYNVKRENTTHPRKMIFTKGYRYKGDIHEDIPEQNSCMITGAYVEDLVNDYHLKRTKERMKKDIEILKKNADDPRNVYFLGVSNTVMGRLDEAVYWFKKRIEFNYDEGTTQSYLYLIELYRTMQNYNKCFSYCTEFIKKYPNDARMPEFLLLMYYLTKDKTYVKTAYDSVKLANFKVPSCTYTVNEKIYNTIIPDEYKKSIDSEV